MNFTSRTKLIAFICYFSFLGNISFSFLFSNEVMPSENFDKQDITEQEKFDASLSEVPEDMDFDGSCEDGRMLEFLEFAFNVSPAEVVAILDEPEVSEKIKQELIDTPEKVERYESLTQKCEEYQSLQEAKVPDGVDIKAYSSVVQDSLYSLYYKLPNFNGVSFRWFSLLFLYSLYRKTMAMNKFERGVIRNTPEAIFRYGASIFFSGKFILDIALKAKTLKGDISRGEMPTPAELHSTLDSGLTDFKNVEASWEGRRDGLVELLKAEKYKGKLEYVEKNEYPGNHKRWDRFFKPLFKPFYSEEKKEWFEGVKDAGIAQRDKAEKELHDSKYKFVGTSFDCFKKFDDPLRKYLERKAHISLARSGWSPLSRKILIKFIVRYPSHLVLFKALPFSLYRGMRRLTEREDFFHENALFKGYDKNGVYKSGDLLLQEMIKSSNRFVVGAVPEMLRHEIGYERMLDWKNKSLGLIRPTLIKNILNYGTAHLWAKKLDKAAKDRYPETYEEHLQRLAHLATDKYANSKIDKDANSKIDKDANSQVDEITEKVVSGNLEYFGGNVFIDSTFSSVKESEDYQNGNALEKRKMLREEFYESTRKKIHDESFSSTRKKLYDSEYQSIYNSNKTSMYDRIKSQEKIWRPADFGCSQSAKKMLMAYSTKSIVSFFVMKGLSKTKGSSRVFGKCYDVVLKHYVKKGLITQEQADQLKVVLKQFSLFVITWILIVGRALDVLDIDDTDMFEVERSGDMERITDLVVSRVVGELVWNIVEKRVT